MACAIDYGLEIGLVGPGDNSADRKESFCDERVNQIEAILAEGAAGVLWQSRSTRKSRKVRIFTDM